MVLTSYMLTLSEAGQFGLVVTFQGLASFAFGYERHTDIQRRMVGQDPALFDQAVTQALLLFSVNYLLVAPFFIAALVFAVNMPAPLIILCLIIAIAEQLMNQAYLMSMVNRRYLPLLVVAVGKNIAIVVAVFLPVLLTGDGVELNRVLSIWAIGSCVAVGLCTGLWLRLRLTESELPQIRISTVLGRQYRASWNHFLLGLTAILTLQADRLITGAVLSLDQVGIFFRHVLLVSMIYQVFNIAFYNRVLPKVFELARTETVPSLRRIVTREFIRVLAFVALVAAVGSVFNIITGGQFIERFSLVPMFFIGLLLVSSIRMRADFNALIFNALHRERTIFHLQLISFVFSIPLMLGLTFLYGIPGTIAAGFCSAFLYFVLTTAALRRLPDKASYAR
ncbi:MAG: hypothetical protein ABJL33_15140 [Hyphomicrobiales bacterium]